MKPSAEWLHALDGTTFSSGAAFEIPPVPGDVPNRLDLAVELAEGRRVVHVGCVDHLPLLDEKLAAGTWMHQRLDTAAQHCVGVDTNADGIDALRSRGWADVHVGDIRDPDSFIEAGSTWDLLFLGEMLEHTDDPIGFLDAIRTAWHGRCDLLVFTVPNAFAWSALRGVLRSTEVVNTDHRYWFTPFTAAKVATRAGFEVLDITMCENTPPPAVTRPLSRIKQRALQRWLSRRPINCSSIVLTLRFDA